METLIKRNYLQPQFWKWPGNSHNFTSVILSESTLFSGTFSFFRDNQQQYGVWWATLIKKLKYAERFDSNLLSWGWLLLKNRRRNCFLNSFKTLYFLLFSKFSKMFRGQEKIKLQAKENVLPCENRIRINTVNQSEHFK